MDSENTTVRGFNTPLQNFDNLPSLNADVNLLLGLSRPTIGEKMGDKPKTRGVRKSSRVKKSTISTKYKDYVL
jgi:hypothetical protein